MVIVGGTGRIGSAVASHLLGSKPKDSGLKQSLEATLATTVSPQNVAALLELATSVESESLRVACMTFARNNLSKVMCDPDFSALLQNRSDLVFELLTALDDTQADAKA